jgi:hypothetical protein
MKKISTTRAEKFGKMQVQRLTIGLDLGDRSSWYCVLDERGELVLEQKHDPEGYDGSVRGNAAQPDCPGNRNAFAVGESAIERTRPRNDRGPCAQPALLRREFHAFRGVAKSGFCPSLRRCCENPCLEPLSADESVTASCDRRAIGPWAALQYR